MSLCCSLKKFNFNRVENYTEQSVASRFKDKIYRDAHTLLRGIFKLFGPLHTTR